MLRSPDLLGGRVPVDEAWRDFEQETEVYREQLAETVGLAYDAEPAEGFLRRELVAEVGRQRLDERFLKVALREYQAFGVRFALVRRHVILGDEAGLGKAVQAIAALAHQWGEGARCFLVARPGSVLLNWVRDIEAFSSLPAYLIPRAPRYRAAEGDVAAMRRAVYSAKLRRLKELVREAEAGGLKVVVRSCPDVREAAGEEDAAVVIFCEPREPEAEARVVGSGSGMVRVHRLIAPGTVDEWIDEVAG